MFGRRHFESTRRVFAPPGGGAPPPVTSRHVPQRLSAQELIAEAFSVFGDVGRPAHFTNHEHCEECREHDDTLLAHDPASITRQALGTMGWDPITFTTDEGFRYYLPGLIRVVLTETGNESYIEQFLWHMTGSGDYQRVRCFSKDEKSVVASVLHFLLEHRTAELQQECLDDEILAAIETWTRDDA